MALKVIGAGLGRTGTMSLKQALEKLGFGRTHHMSELIRAPEEFRFWGRLAMGEKLDWDEVFRGYSSCCDWPSASYWRELAEHYPDAKVILSTRDPQKWFDSMSATILSNEPNPDVESLRTLPEDLQGMVQMTMGKFLAEFYAEGAPGRERTIEIFNRHNEEVKRTIPASRLLVFQASDGWEPLCRFLGVPVPNEPYPVSNETDKFGHAIEG